MSELDGFEQQVSGAIAAGVNQAAEIGLNDIRLHVQIRSGRLRNSYAIVRRAAPSSPSAEVGSAVSYRGQQYPFAVPHTASERNRYLQGNPLVNPATGDTGKLDAQISGAIEAELNRRLGG